MGKSYVKDIDRGYKKIKQELIKLRKQEVAVGLQAGDMTQDGKMTVAQLGAIHEFGATINREAHSIMTYHKMKLNRKTGETSISKFVKKKRANFAMQHNVGPYSIVIPERPFLKNTFDEKNKEWERAAIKQVDLVTAGKKDAATVLDALGLMIQRDIQKKIVDGPFTPNAPSTIRKKRKKKRGAITPLIDSGRMRSSVRYIIRGRGEGKKK